MRKEIKIELLLYAAITVIAVSLSAVYHLPKIAYILSFAGYPLARYKLGKPAIIVSKEELEVVEKNDEKSIGIYKGAKLFQDVILADTPPASLRIPIAVGLNYRGAIEWADMTAVLSCLIAGLQGMGKSNFLEGLIQSAMYYKPERVVYIMADFKKLGLVDYRNLSNTVFTSDYLELSKLLDKALEIMESRLDLFIDNNGVKACKNINDWHDQELPWIFIIIDEVADISDSEEYGEELWDKLTAILRKGRAVGIIVILATQRPTTTSIPGKLGALLDTRFVMRVKNANESRYCHVANAHLLKNPGEMVVESRVINGYYKTLELKQEDQVFYKLLEATRKQPNSVMTLVQELSSCLSGASRNGISLVKNGYNRNQLEAFKSLLESDNDIPGNQFLMESLGLSKWQLEQLKKEAEKEGIIKKAGKTKYVVGDL